MSRYAVMALLIGWLVVMPKTAEAVAIDIRFATAEEQWVTEVWYDNHLFWQVAFCYDGVVPVSTNNARYRTLVVPVFSDGLFQLQIR